MHNSNILTNPTLKGGYSLIYENILNINIKYIDYNKKTSTFNNYEQLIFKIFTKGQKPQTKQLKIEISSQNDPFFILHTQITQSTYCLYKSDLDCCYQQFSTYLITILNKLQQNKVKTQNLNYQALLTIESDGLSQLLISTNSSINTCIILNLTLHPHNQSLIEQYLTYNYQQLKSALSQSETRLQKIIRILQDKNPTLLTIIHKVHQ